VPGGPYAMLQTLSAATRMNRVVADFVAEVRCRLFWSVIPSL